MKKIYISDKEAIRNILADKKANKLPNFMFWIGAGFSADAGVKTAQAICNDIRDELFIEYEIDNTDAEKAGKWLEENLDWEDLSKRYMTCLQKFYPNEAKRNEFFHKILVDAQPSLSHYILALLISNGYVKSTCFTTNFDHLIENAFTQQDIGRFQTVRTDEECIFWENRIDRAYIVKLHGDIDTQNVMNTRKETAKLSDAMANLFKDASHNSGLVVIGTAGNEKSVRKVFEELGDRVNKNPVSSFGLLWGVYMGPKRPLDLTDSEIEKLLDIRIKETGINEEIINVIEDSNNGLFKFFPVWGAGNFMFDLIKATRNDELISRASQHLDHEMRLRFIYSNAGLTDNAIEQHLENLRRQREKRDKYPPEQKNEIDLVLKARNEQSNIEVRVLYGDITNKFNMRHDEFKNKRKAIVSPEDTCVSAGGGVAYSILLEAGQKALLNELAKFSPIEQNTVAVTSAGNLPLHYIFHAASLKIESDATYSVNKQNVRQTMSSVLQKAQNLDVGILWVPLLAAGAASLKPIDSLDAILTSIAQYAKPSDVHSPSPLTIILMIYREKTIPRHFVADSFARVLPPGPEWQVLS